MKKEENQKKNVVLRNGQDFHSRSNSPKAYSGCDTCKLKIKSLSKLSDCGVSQDKNKNKNQTEKDGQKNQNVKLTDLCEEDKKRIVELIEELSKLAEKNQQLKDIVDQMQKERQEQQEYYMKQAKLHLEEKNFYVSEISEFKTRIETLESEMRNRAIQWETRERSKDSEIAHLAKALQKSLKEKNQVHEQMDHLKICLKHSLESFQRLRAEMSELQRQEANKSYTTASCQTDSKPNALKEKHKMSDPEETEDEEFLSTCNQDSINAKSSLDIINDKLEYVYQMLKRKGDGLTNAASQNHDVDFSALVKNGKSPRELTPEENTLGNREFQTADKSPQCDESENKFQKPFEQCSRTSIQAERILKNFGKPLNLINRESLIKTENNKTSSNKFKEPARDLVALSNFLQHNVIQKNALFKSSGEYQYDEDKLLEELFYPEQTTNFGIEYDLKREPRIMGKTYERPFTW